MTKEFIPIDIRADRPFAYQERRFVETRVHLPREASKVVLTIKSDPAAWVVNGVRIDGESVCVGDPIPGEIFAAGGVGMSISLPPIRSSVSLEVTYVGDCAESGPFIAMISRASLDAI